MGDKARVKVEWLGQIQGFGERCGGKGVGRIGLLGLRGLKQEEKIENRWGNVKKN